MVKLWLQSEKSNYKNLTSKSILKSRSNYDQGKSVLRVAPQPVIDEDTFDHTTSGRKILTFHILNKIQSLWLCMLAFNFL